MYLHLGKSRGYSACKRLRSMCFRRCAGLTDDVIIAIQPCKQLDTLELLDCTMITDDGFVTMSEGSVLIPIYTVHNLEKEEKNTVFNK